MTINMAALFLVGLILLGVLSNNNTITVAATVLLLMQQTALARFLPLVDKHALHWGITLLTIGVLSPLVSGKYLMPHYSAFFNFKMLLAIIMGILVAWLAGRGVSLMSIHPVLVTGLIIGTILGVAFWGGVPVGPLIAAGILSFFVNRG